LSRYDDLCALAVTYSRQFHDHTDACRRLAAGLILEYAAYLSCPEDNIKQVELDRSLKPTENEVPLAQRLPVTIDPEGFVHFAWHVHFERRGIRHTARELITFGLRITGDSATIREDRDFSILVASRDSWTEFFEYLHQLSQHGFSAPYGTRRTRIGFLRE